MTQENPKVLSTGPTVANPANEPPAELAKAPRRRVPMSAPTQKLQTPEVPGYHLHWFREENVMRALQAGYEFVNDGEVQINQLGVATSKDITGNSDMGTRIRVVSGKTEQGQAEYGVLMKLRSEFWEEDQSHITKRNASVMQAIFTKEFVPGSEDQTADDKALRYVKTALFNRPPRKATTSG